MRRLGEQSLYIHSSRGGTKSMPCAHACYFKRTRTLLLEVSIQIKLSIAAFLISEYHDAFVVSVHRATLQISCCQLKQRKATLLTINDLGANHFECQFVTNQSMSTTLSSNFVGMLSLLFCHINYAHFWKLSFS